MTLVLAVKTEDAIYLASDMLFFNLGKPFSLTSEESTQSHGYKTHPAYIGDQVLVFGAAGRFDGATKTQERVAEYLSRAGKNQPLDQVCRHLVYQDPLTIGTFQKEFVFGYTSEEGLKLLIKNNQKSPRLVPCDFGGIGSGYYPEVEDMLKSQHSPKMGEARAVHLLKETMDVAREVSGAINSHPLEGIHIRKVTADQHLADLFEDRYVKRGSLGLEGLWR